MLAIQIKSPGNVEVIDLDMPQLRPGEVLIKIDYVGFCGSDLNTFRGKNLMAISPVIPGHEIGGTIEAVGDNVPEGMFTKGMNVTVNPYTACGKCSSCRKSRPNACEHNETLGVQRHGAMREYIAIPWEKVIPAPGISSRDCALIEPMSVGFHAVDRGAVTDIDTVMVIGCGMIGLGAIVRAAMRGATVIATDLDDDKLELAKRLGATYTINSAKENIHGRIWSRCSCRSCRITRDLCNGSGGSGICRTSCLHWLFKVGCHVPDKAVCAERARHTRFTQCVAGRLQRRDTLHATRQLSRRPACQRNSDARQSARGASALVG